MTDNKCGRSNSCVQSRKWSIGDLAAFHDDAIDLLEWVLSEFGEYSYNDDIQYIKEPIEEFLNDWEMVRLAYENDRRNLIDD